MSAAKLMIRKRVNIESREKVIVIELLADRYNQLVARRVREL